MALLRFPVLVLILLVSYKASAQAVIEFEKIRHDFGKIKEEKGPVEYEFKFTNKGKSPLVITNVKASCGCTIPSWSKEAVEPGKTGYIKAQYNPKNRPGVFDKTLTVTANTEPPTSTLRIHGIVAPRSKAPAGDTLGNIRLRSKILDFESINTKEPVTREFMIYNDGEEPINISNATQVPKHFKVVVTPNVLPPMKEGVIRITYDPKIKNDFGQVTDDFVLPTNDVKMPKKTLFVRAEITEYFPPLTPEELANAPKIEFSKTSHDFGILREGAVLTTEIEFRNRGKKDLIIRKTKSSCACLSGYPAKYVVKPGDSSKIKISLNTKGKAGKGTNTINIFSTDPSSPLSTITIKANVVD